MSEPTQKEIAEIFNLNRFACDNHVTPSIDDWNKIASYIDKLTQQNQELIEALESTSRELHMTIEEVNYRRTGEINCLTESPPDLWDMETLHINQVLIAKIKGES